MAEAFPDRINKITNRIRDIRGGKLTESAFHQRHQGVGTYWQMIEQLYEVSRRRAGFLDVFLHLVPAFSLYQIEYLTFL